MDVQRHARVADAGNPTLSEQGWTSGRLHVRRHLSHI